MKVSRKRRSKHTSLRMVCATGRPAPSWTPAIELSTLANECFRACINPAAKSDLIRVYRNTSDRNHGRCFVSQRVITIGRHLCDPSHTLAHEIAHLRFASHGPRHAELTETLFQWISNQQHEEREMRGTMKPLTNQFETDPLTNEAYEFDDNGNQTRGDDDGDK